MALFGLGGSGMVAAHALSAGGCEVVAFDDNPGQVEKARAQGITVGDLREEDFSKFDALVLAPGVPLTHPEPHWSVELAHANNVPIIGDIELFCQQRAKEAPNSNLVAITGTNGKSTTTALVSHVLKHAGRRIEMGGNIGRPVLEFDHLDNETIYVVEVSSYQIDLAPGLGAEYGVLLNISPDHLDRHGNMKNYAAIKERVITSAQHALVSVDDAMSAAIAERHLAQTGQVVKISIGGAVDHGMYFDGGKIIWANEGTSQQVADLDGIGSLRGPHNGQNACIAWYICHDLGLTNAEIQAGFESFASLEHRMEELGHIDDILIVNDSKGTNADATQWALGSFDQVHWIAGGIAKEEGIKPLSPLFGHVAKAYLIGKAAPEFAAELKGKVAYEISGTLEQALKDAVTDINSGNRDAASDAVILLSPACASFDQYRSYEVRGEAFRELVENTNGFVARN